MTATSGTPEWIEDRIRATGLAVVGVSNAVPCADCGEVHDDSDPDAFVYTVGRAARGLPEFLTLLIIPQEIQQVADLFNFLDHQDRQGQPVRANQRIQTGDPDAGTAVYWITIDPDPDDTRELNADYTIAAHNRNDGDVALLLVEREERIAADVTLN